MVKRNQSSVSTIKSKLIAAIAMLLVGVFMIVSSSYAWFTLSTAPEVTGIYTSVGANGNLEMALVPDSGNLSDITSDVGDTGKNNTWGNLVDLSQTNNNQSIYGLDLIQLMPSRLDAMVSANENYDYMLNTGAGLLAPKYGADGRVDSLISTVLGKYDSDSKAFDQASDAHGVVAIGTASGMTPQQSYWLQAKKTVNSKLVSAQNYADKSFENVHHQNDGVTESGEPVKINVSNGEMLANVIMARAIDGENAVCDIRFVPDMVAQLELANADLKEAMEAYLAALAAIALEDLDANAWSTAVSEIADIDVDSITGTTITISGETVDLSADTGFTTVLGKYNKIKAILTYVDEAYTTYAASGSVEAASWADASAILFTDVDGNGQFVNYNEVMLNGYTPDYIKENIIKGNASPSNQDLFNFGMDFLENGVVDFTSGSGVHADLAEVVGEYQSEINLSITYGEGSFPVDNVKLRAVKDQGVAGVNLYDKLTIQPAGNDDAAQSNPITDVYGYRLDFAFRTNAKGSSLMLQTDATGRIYSDGGSEDTMGNGSTMTFKILDEAFSQTQAKELMTAVRIVFLDKEGNIVALGLLQQNTSDATAYKISANGDITSNITLYEFSFDTDGKLDVGNKIEPTDGKTELMALNQNEATQLSALVYLDGDKVDNSMVSAGKSASISGSLNLQFSSSADLKPMDYAEFQGSQD